MTRETLLALAAKVEALSGPCRETDAEIMFDLFARPVGQREDGGPVGYLWPEDNPSWNFGIRFPGSSREKIGTARSRSEGETLVIERDGAPVLMNDLRIPKVTASIDATRKILAPGTLWAVGSMEEGPFARLCHPMPDGTFVGGYVEGRAATAELSLCAAALRARAAA